jgi:hypothetical protein
MMSSLKVRLDPNDVVNAGGADRLLGKRPRISEASLSDSGKLLITYLSRF